MSTSASPLADAPAGDSQLAPALPRLLAATPGVIRVVPPARAAERRETG